MIPPKATISIVIPVYNAKPYLARCIRSVIEQAYELWELILVDDGSTDTSLDICESFAQNDARIMVLSQYNAGPSAARNKGIKAAKTEYVTFVDADDWVDRDYLKELLTPILDAPEIDLVCCDYIEFSKFNPAGLKLYQVPGNLRNTEITNFDFAPHVFSGVNGVVWGKVFKNSILKAHNIQLDNRIRLSEDMVFVLEYLTYVNKVFAIDLHLYFYNRLNENNLSGLLKMKHLQDLELTSVAIRKLAPSLHLDAEQIEQERRRRMLKKLTYDILISEDKTFTEKRTALATVSQMTGNFNSLEVSGVKDKVHFFFIQNKLYKLDFYFLKTFDALRDILALTKSIS